MIRAIRLPKRPNCPTPPDCRSVGGPSSCWRGARRSAAPALGRQSHGAGPGLVQPGVVAAFRLRFGGVVAGTEHLLDGAALFRRAGEQPLGGLAESVSVLRPWAANCAITGWQRTVRRANTLPQIGTRLLPSSAWKVRWVMWPTPPVTVIRPVPAPRADLVFHDFNFTNVLVLGVPEDSRSGTARSPALSGIVDIDFLALGDRSLDLAELAFQYELRRGGDGRIEGHRHDPVELLAGDVLRISGAAGRRQPVAYLTLAHLGWIGPGGQQDPEVPCVRAAGRLMDLPDLR